MGPLGVCVERTTILQQSPSVDFPTTRASQPASQSPSPFPPFSYAKASLVFLFSFANSFPSHPFAPRTTLRAFQPPGVP